MKTATLGPVSRNLQSIETAVENLRTAIQTNDSVPSELIAAELYRRRRARDSVFGEDADLFGEPAWDMLLDLYVAAARRQSIPVSNACLAASTPTTTALRYLRALEERGLIDRRQDPHDRRRVYVDLTPRAVAMLHQCLSAR